MSCNNTSTEELDSITPVNPPIENKKINPNDHNKGTDLFTIDPCKVANHLKILIPVGTAIIIVADVK